MTLTLQLYNVLYSYIIFYHFRFLMFLQLQEVVSTTLLDSGTYNGQLAASAMNSNPYFQQKYKFETCPTARNRHKNRLLRFVLYFEKNKLLKKLFIFSLTYISCYFYYSHICFQKNVASNDRNGNKVRSASCSYYHYNRQRQWSG